MSDSKKFSFVELFYSGKDKLFIYANDSVVYFSPGVTCPTVPSSEFERILKELDHYFINVPGTCPSGFSFTDLSNIKHYVAYELINHVKVHLV
ncbi:MAG TPA: hypothetical protein PL056_11095 [bacterium]|nr:hypothetical protein [bacterium]